MNPTIRYFEIAWPDETPLWTPDEFHDLVRNNLDDGRELVRRFAGLDFDAPEIVYEGRVYMWEPYPREPDLVLTTRTVRGRRKTADAYSQAQSVVLNLIGRPPEGEWWLLVSASDRAEGAPSFVAYSAPTHSTWGEPSRGGLTYLEGAAVEVYMRVLREEIALPEPHEQSTAQLFAHELLGHGLGLNHHDDPNNFMYVAPQDAWSLAGDMIEPSQEAVMRSSPYVIPALAEHGIEDPTGAVFRYGLTVVAELNSPDRPDAGEPDPPIFEVRYFERGQFRNVTVDFAETFDSTSPLRLPPDRIAWWKLTAPPIDGVRITLTDPDGHTWPAAPAEEIAVMSLSSGFGRYRAATIDTRVGGATFEDEVIVQFAAPSAPEPVPPVPPTPEPEPPPPPSPPLVDQIIDLGLGDAEIWLDSEILGLVWGAPHTGAIQVSVVGGPVLGMLTEPTDRISYELAGATRVMIRTLNMSTLALEDRTLSKRSTPESSPWIASPDGGLVYGVTVNAGGTPELRRIT